MPAARLFRFSAGDAGAWRMTRVRALTGESLSPAARLTVDENHSPPTGATRWTFRGIISNERYVERAERSQLAEVQPSLGRPGATRAVLIPIRKSIDWWQLTQDERREIFEARSRHIATGMRYLPAVARRLYHCRDLGEDEPFDFLTWFEFDPAQVPAFEDLLAALRATPEWVYVEREVEVWLERDQSGAA